MAKKKGKKVNKPSAAPKCAFAFYNKLVHLVSERYGNSIPGDYEYLLELLASPAGLVRSKGSDSGVFAKADSSFRADRIFEKLLSEFDIEEKLCLVPETYSESRQMREFAGSVKMGAMEDTIWRRITGYANFNRELAQAVSNRFRDMSVLEIMGGNGLISRLLMDCGMRVVCTDIAPGKGNEYYSMRGNTYCDVLAVDALGAVKRFGAKSDLLICSWPPQGEEQVLHAVQLYFRIKPNGYLLYFGELSGGVNATCEFFDGLQVADDLKELNKLHISHIGSGDVIRLFRPLETEANE